MEKKKLLKKKKMENKKQLKEEKMENKILLKKKKMENKKLLKKYRCGAWRTLDQLLTAVVPGSSPAFTRAA